MQPVACATMGQEINKLFWSKELVVVSTGMLVKTEYLFPTELESLGG